MKTSLALGMTLGIVLSSALGSTGCARSPTVVGKGASPVLDRRVHRSSEMRIMLGLVGRGHEGLARRHCANGNAYVTERTTFGNALVTFLSGGFLVPKQVTVYCFDPAHRKMMQAHLERLRRLGPPPAPPPLPAMTMQVGQPRFSRRVVVHQPYRPVHVAPTPTPTPTVHRPSPQYQRRPQPSHRPPPRYQAPSRRPSVRVSYTTKHVRNYKARAQNAGDCDRVIPAAKGSTLHVRIALTQAKRKSCYQCVRRGKAYFVYHLRPLNGNCE